MIRVERKDTKKARAAIAVLSKAKAKDAGYNQPEVNDALREMFHGKCYICGYGGPTSYQIEHLVPHREDLNLKYDWDNLLLSCAHCNNTKLAKFDPILDCTREDVDLKIAFRKEGYFGIDEKWVFQSLQGDSEEVNNTVGLLEAVFYGTTAQKKMEAKNLRKCLRKDIEDFKQTVRDYLEAEGEEKEDLLCDIQKDLRDSANFVAFKRWLLRDHPDRFQELIEKCGIKCGDTAKA